MNTITEKEFFESFMKISQDLTFSEVRMLYLLITEPFIIDFSQQNFAKRIQAHRRTINIGLKKLKDLKYISEGNSREDEEIVNESFESSEDIIINMEYKTAKQVIINSFEDYYLINKKDFIINEDFYSFILGDIRLPLKYRHNNSFVTETIRKNYPEIKFYFEQIKSCYKDENHYFINRIVNSEILRARKNRYYSIKTNDILSRLEDNFSIEREEALRMIKSTFPKIRITEKKICVRKPFKGN